MKETSRIKSSFIHATRGGWEQLPLLKDQLLESQEKLLKAYKDLIALEEEKKAREAALAEAREASKIVDGENESGLSASRGRLLVDRHLLFILRQFVALFGGGSSTSRS